VPIESPVADLGGRDGDAGQEKASPSLGAIYRRSLTLEGAGGLLVRQVIANTHSIMMPT
jgi:hypothetical protein